MTPKFIEIRDAHTFVPVLAVDISRDDGYLARRAGFGSPLIILVLLTQMRCHYDPYSWSRGERTYHVAHKWLQEHWAEVASGDVVDVEFILGETVLRMLAKAVSWLTRRRSGVIVTSLRRFEKARLRTAPKLSESVNTWRRLIRLPVARTSSIRPEDSDEQHHLVALTLDDLKAVLATVGYRVEVSADGTEERLYRPDGTLVLVARRRLE